MNTRLSHNTLLVCDQCGLPYGRGGVIRVEGTHSLHFCCYGCSFTHTLTGEEGDSGLAGLFLFRLGFTAFLSMNIMLLSWVIYDQHWAAFGIDDSVLPALEKLMFVLATPIMVVVGYPFVRNAVGEVRRLRLSMDSLIALGSFAAYAFSTYQLFTGGHGIYFDTGTMVLVLVTAGRYIEATAKVRTSGALRRLIELQPDVARHVLEGREEIVPSATVNPGSIVKVLPGERIPLDGAVIEGTTTVNESLLTGESVPSVKHIGDRVFAATVNGEGAILLRTTETQAGTVHAKIVRSMEEAQRSRSPIQQRVDRISAVFIPVVLGISGLTFLGWFFVSGVETAFLHAMTVLVVACPCALGIGTPVAAATALWRAAEAGVLVRSTAVLEKLADIRQSAFDKTGTLTRGELSLSSIASSLERRTFLSILASLEENSEHPLGKGIVRYARARKIPALPSRNVTAILGYGIGGDVLFDGLWQPVLAGTRELLEREGCNVAPDIMKDENPETQLHLAIDGKYVGSVSLQDELRATASDTVEALHKRGISTTLLSGDSVGVSRKIGLTVGVKDVRARLSPREKLEALRQLRDTGATMMIGDGINDAPALAAADVGIALGSASDIARDTADVLVLGDRLETIPTLLDLSKRMVRTIRWNLAWAFGYNAIALILAASGLLQPILAAVMMIASSVTILYNSRRLNKFSFNAPIHQ